MQIEFRIVPGVVEMVVECRFLGRRMHPIRGASGYLPLSDQLQIIQRPRLMIYEHLLFHTSTEFWHKDAHRTSYAFLIARNFCLCACLSFGCLETRESDLSLVPQMGHDSQRRLRAVRWRR